MIPGIAAVPRRLVPQAPIPRAPAAALRRRAEPPAPLPKERSRSAVYLLDAGVGLAFAHVRRLDLLHTHFGEQLRYVEDVLVEWRSLALRPSRPGGDVARDAALRAAAGLLVRTAERLLGPAVVLSISDSDEVAALMDEVRRIEGSTGAGATRHRGECATVLHGTRLKGDVEVVVICANDHGARCIAQNHGIAHRYGHEVLREMVAADLLTASGAWALFQEMSTVTQVPATARPSGADYFR